MVREVKKNGKTFYVCESCGFTYEAKELAQKCQDWCEKHHSCNLEIARYAVNLEQV